MQLKYRGVHYKDGHSNIEASLQNIGGIYRGVPWHKEYQNKSTKPIGIVRLKYRGMNYSRIVCGK